MVEIKVTRVKVVGSRQRMIAPLTNKALFRHCADGKTRVTPREWRNNVQPLLMLHGVSVLQEVEA